MAHLSKLSSVYNDIGYSQEETAKMELMIYQVEQAAYSKPFHSTILGYQEEHRTIINTDQSCCHISIVNSIKLYSVSCVNMHIFSLKGETDFLMLESIAGYVIHMFLINDELFHPPCSITKSCNVSTQA